MAALSYAGEQVRLYDHDRFLTAIFAPAALREDLFALYAFNLEIAKTGEVVSESLIGQMRLQWWRDALDRLYAGHDIAHGVARPLGEAIRRHEGLPRAAFDQLIDAREADLDRSPPADMSALAAYAEATAASLVELAARIVSAGGPLPNEAAEAASLTGAGWALTGLLRAVPFHARQHRLYLPQDLLDDAKVRTGRLFDLKPDPRLGEVVRQVAEEAVSRLQQARKPIGAIPRRARSPFLLAPLARIYLGDLGRAGWNPFMLEGRVHPLMVARLAMKALSGRY